MQSLLINSGGITLMLLIIWWFFFSRPKALQSNAADAIRIQVSDGSYQPARIQIPAGQPVVLRFKREDASPCAAQVVIEALGLNTDLRLNEDTDVQVQFDAPGEYEFTCQMKMYRGTLVVS